MCGEKYWRLYTVQYVGKNTGNYIQYFLTLVLFTCCILRCLVCIAVFTLDAGLSTRSQYSEVPATGHLDIVFSWFLCL